MTRFNRTRTERGDGFNKATTASSSSEREEITTELNRLSSRLSKYPNEKERLESEAYGFLDLVEQDSCDFDSALDSYNQRLGEARKLTLELVSDILRTRRKIEEVKDDDFEKGNLLQGLYLRHVERNFGYQNLEHFFLLSEKRLSERLDNSR